MDYPNKRRLKILVNTEVIEAADRPELVKRLAVSGYKAKIERAIILNVEGFDWNCPQHITPRYTVEEIRQIGSAVVRTYRKIRKRDTGIENGAKMKEFVNKAMTYVEYVGLIDRLLANGETTGTKQSARDVRLRKDQSSANGAARENRGT